MTSIQKMRETPIPEPNRLFFAVWPSDEIRARIAVAANFLCARHSLGGRRIKPERYHLTLKFLGDDVPQVVEAAVLKAAARIEAPPFSLRLNLAGSFSNPKIPIWLGPNEPPPELYHLDEALHRAIGKPPRKRKPSLKPHVTILREAREQLPVEPIIPIDWRMEEFVLIRSVLHRERAEYKILQRYPLSGGPLPAEPQQFSLLS